ncbi:MAG: beta-N-acetylglucosaminidase domain-containing protein [Phycisphaerae bacterium]
MRLSRIAAIAISALPAACLSAGKPKPQALAAFAGSEFAGGAKDLFGAVMDGEPVNYVYAQPTGDRSRMQVVFHVNRIPAEPLFVHIKGRDDDAPGQCTIAIELNGVVLFVGRSAFSPRGFETRRFPIPAGALKTGENTLAIINREKEGRLGMPPWFQVAACVVGPEECVIRRDPTKDFSVTLPETVEPLPTPLPPGKEPGFKFRGTKGWMWTPQQYMAEIPVLAKYRMNFLMNCYTSMCDVEHYKWGDPNVNRWWEPLPEEKKAAYAKVVKACREQGVSFCFSMNPNLCSKRFVNSGNPADVDALWQHYAWAQGLGVKWFNISLDDISQGIDAAAQAKVVNEILRRLREKDPGARMIFCPTYYWGDGTGKEQKPYLETLAQELDRDVYVFWTGDAVVGRITRKAAETFRGIVQRRLFLWDNYPVNDAQPTMHLGPVTGRDADLCEVIDGYMSNPLCQQNEANRIPLLTCADYAYNPGAYDPARSIGQAIVHLAETPAQRNVMRDLVEAYPGMLIYGNGNTGFNAVRHKYAQITGMPHSRQAAQAYIKYLERLAVRIKEAFPHGYAAEKKTLDTDIQWLRQMQTAKYGE